MASGNTANPRYSFLTTVLVAALGLFLYNVAQTSVSAGALITNQVVKDGSLSGSDGENGTTAAPPTTPAPNSSIVNGTSYKCGKTERVLVAHPVYCDYYANCWDGLTVPYQSCPSGMLFDASQGKGYCNYPDQTSCNGRLNSDGTVHADPTPTPTPATTTTPDPNCDCSTRTNAMFVYKPDCAKFCNCAGNTGFVQSCANYPNTWFDQNSTSCVWCTDFDAIQAGCTPPASSNSSCT